MSNLPPKPDFEPPPRHPADARHFVRASSRATPDRRDRPMDSYVPGRSPSRRREDAYVTGDTYIPPPRHEPYRGRPVDSYTPGYDRRDGERHRETYRAREPPPQHNAWRVRDHPPPTDWRYARDAKVGAAWSRSKEAENHRYWETREHSRRGYEGDYSPPKRRDSQERPPTPQRTWVPRPSKSPPRRMAPDTPQPGPSGHRDRSPPPHFVTRDDAPFHSRDRSPRRRRSLSYDSRRDRRSPPLSPRKDDRVHRDRSPYDDRRRSPYRDRSKGHSRSPARRPYRRGGRGRRGRNADNAEAGEVDESLSRSPSLSRSRTRSRTRSLSPSRSRSASRSPVVKREHRLPKRPTPDPIKLKVRTPSPVVKREPSPEHVLPVEYPSADTKGKMKEVAPTIDADGDVKMEDEAKPSDLKSTSGASPIAPATPHTPHHIPPKPDWSQAEEKKPGPPLEQAASAEVKQSALPVQPALPEIQLKEWKPPENRTLDSLLTQLARLEESRLKQVKEHEALKRSTRRAMHELDMAARELKFAEKRRVIADAQLEKARAGILVADNSRKAEATATR